MTRLLTAKHRQELEFLFLPKEQGCYRVCEAESLFEALRACGVSHIDEAEAVELEMKLWATAPLPCRGDTRFAAWRCSENRTLVTLVCQRIVSWLWLE